MLTNFIYSTKNFIKSNYRKFMILLIAVMSIGVTVIGQVTSMASVITFLQMDNRRKPPKLTEDDETEQPANSNSTVKQKPKPIPSVKPPDSAQPSSSVLDCKNSNNGFSLCTLPLLNFEKGVYTHPRLDSFVKSVADTIEFYEKRAGGISIKRITVQGFADAYKNNGVDDWRNVPSGCNDKLIGKLNDEELAKVRGCIVKKALQNLLDGSVLIKNKPEEIKPVDYKDNEPGKKDGKYRKVEVVFTIIGEN